MVALTRDRGLHRIVNSPHVAGPTKAGRAPLGGFRCRGHDKTTQTTAWVEHTLPFTVSLAMPSARQCFSMLATYCKDYSNAYKGHQCEALAVIRSACLCVIQYHCLVRGRSHGDPAMRACAVCEDPPTRTAGGSARSPFVAEHFLAARLRRTDLLLSLQVSHHEAPIGISLTVLMPTTQCSRGL
jgi:hypothetical protein